ncbi:hypothetical protein BJ322DRAFT_242871 [Thelephora terrestris]|uniref:Uncharacterized protein n=1 Tax=Thelephora terrestris TaxID=56493 RepID=A0A9P6HBI6_9AGAM|nr:hypothetical protein BJ322DRAFT_242871 [Thelephora terrestris]
MTVKIGWSAVLAQVDPTSIRAPRVLPPPLPSLIPGTVSDTASSDATPEREQALEEFKARFELMKQQQKVQATSANTKDRLRGGSNPRAGAQVTSIGLMSHQTNHTVITRRNDPTCTMALAHPRLGVAQLPTIIRRGTRRVKTEALGEFTAHLYLPTGRCLRNTGDVFVRRLSPGPWKRSHDRDHRCKGHHSVTVDEQLMPAFRWCLQD